MNETQLCNYNNYKSMHENARALLNLVDTYVKVELIKNCSFTGFVHSIDPVTRSIILSIPEDEAFKTVILPGHAILEVTTQEIPSNVQLPQKKEKEITSPEAMLKRKAKIMSWLRIHLLPVSELDDKIVIGNASILPPYNIIDLCTDSPIVSTQIRQIMESMPDDYEPK